MYWFSSAHTLNFCTNLLYTAFCILSCLVKNQRSTDLWQVNDENLRDSYLKEKKSMEESDQS